MSFRKFNTILKIKIHLELDLNCRRRENVLTTFMIMAHDFLKNPSCISAARGFMELMFRDTEPLPLTTTESFVFWCFVILSSVQLLCRVSQV